MVYLIVNAHRSGSSMLMRCLEAGGLVPVYDKAADAMNHTAPKDYIPNPNGFYQFSGMVTPGFARIYDGKLIKFPLNKLKDLPPGEYKVILLKRAAKEIRMSMAKWTPFSSWGGHESLTYVYVKYMNAVKKLLATRGNVDLMEVNYRDIVKKPLEVFEQISAAGWPINPALCAEKVDASLHRNKLEKDK